ncbi:metallophosphoesterase [Actinoplanes sp. NPDC049548]|uniref:metallophosphoesterase n=1 Tax=Actinoplanes sp. NPDC049548 TaxID=3155152 RepID=UPI0034246F70
MSLFGFVGLIIVIIGLIHLYLWKRLVRDPLRPGLARRLGGMAMVVLAILVPATLIGTRTGYAKWLAWPGYLWLALMFYLLVTLAVLELPRLAANLWIRARSKPAARSADAESRSAAPTGYAGAKADDAATSSTGTGAGMDGHASFVDAPRGVAADRGPDTPTGTAPRDVAADRSTDSPAPSESGGVAGDHSQVGPSATGSPGVERRLLLARGAAIFAGLTAAGITGYGVKTALSGPRLDRVQIPLAKLPRAMDGTRLAVVSDIHLGPLTGVRHTERIVNLINSVDADIVCVVGDLVDGSVAELGRFAAPLAGITSRRGAYFVTGNHEYYSGFQEWVTEVGRLGVRPLRNERLEIGALDLAGVNDLGGADVGDGPDFKRALGDRDPARPVVLMAHQPIAARDAAPYGVDLQVSGHTHGGQMAPFNLVVKLEQPVVSGLGKVDGVPVYVTNGAGFWGPPVRVGAPPQVSVIDLRTA